MASQSTLSQSRSPSLYGPQPGGIGRLPAAIRKALRSSPVKTILLAALLGGGLTAAGASPDLPIKVGRTVEITLSHARCWFPTVHRFRSGVIMVTMQMA